MKASIFFVIRARSGPRFCSRQIPLKNVTIKPARESLSSRDPRAAARLSLHSNQQLAFLWLLNPVDPRGSPSFKFDYSIGSVLNESSREHAENRSGYLNHRASRPPNP